MFRSASLIALALAIASWVPDAAAEPPPVEMLHAPQKVIVAPTAPIVVFEVLPPLPYQRINRWDVWQYYGVDRHNRWRPRVAYTPYGAFYLANGQPYPYAAIYQRNFVPYVVGQ